MKKLEIILSVIIIILLSIIIIIAFEFDSYKSELKSCLELNKFVMGEWKSAILKYMALT